MPLPHPAFATVFSSARAVGDDDEQSFGLGARQALVTILDRLGEQPVERVCPMIARQRLEGGASTFTRWAFKAGATSPMRRNPGELITWITQGRVEVQADGHALVMGPGDVIIIPPYAAHALAFTADTACIAISTVPLGDGEPRPGRRFQDIARRAVAASAGRSSGRCSPDLSD